MRSPRCDLVGPQGPGLKKVVDQHSGGEIGRQPDSHRRAAYNQQGAKAQCSAPRSYRIPRSPSSFSSDVHRCASLGFRSLGFPSRAASLDQCGSAMHHWVPENCSASADLSEWRFPGPQLPELPCERTESPVIQEPCTRRVLVWRGRPYSQRSVQQVEWTDVRPYKVPRGGRSGCGRNRGK